MRRKRAMSLRFPHSHKFEREPGPFFACWPLQANDATDALGVTIDEESGLTTTNGLVKERGGSDRSSPFRFRKSECGRSVTFLQTETKNPARDTFAHIRK